MGRHEQTAARPVKSMTPTIFVSAGEASGEQYGALTIEALKSALEAEGRRARFVGMGGARMEAAGLKRVVRSEEVAVMGLTEVLRHLPRIYGALRRLRRAIRRERPAVAILIDFPDFHLRLAREFRRLGIPVVYFVSPQLWAWKQHRIHQIRRDVRRMAVIFPFEEDFYREHGVRAEFVGHPLAEMEPPRITRAEYAAAHGLDAGRRWIALLPGSRRQEIRGHLHEMIEVAWRLDLATPRAASAEESYEFLVPLAPTLTAEQRAEMAASVEGLGGGLSMHLVEDARAALYHARAAVVASGTATVEAALIGRPFVVVYRVSRLTFAIAKRVVKVRFAAMVNLIAGREIVPELLQEDFRADRVAELLKKLLAEGPERVAMERDLAAVAAALRGGKKEGNARAMKSVERVAAMAIEEMDAEA